MLHKLQITKLLDSKREDRNSVVGGSNTPRIVFLFYLFMNAFIIIYCCHSQIQGASVNRAILQHCFFLVRQHWGGCRYRDFAANFKAY